MCSRSLRQAPCATELDLGVDCVYNNTMKLTLIAPILALTLSGCAVTTGVNTISAVTTGKTLTDHTVSLITQKDCNAWRMSTELTYYCEYLHDAGTRYNRTGY
jgi:outer membrane murein-binding lipoprotein Lpp